MSFPLVFTIQKFIEDMEHNCNSIGVWTLFWGVISQLLMVVNSSMNFFIYCFMSAVFREVLYANLRQVIFELGTFRCWIMSKQIRK